MVYRFGILVLSAGCLSVVLALPPCVCNRNLKPVCGSDGQTYNNECQLNCAATKNPELRLERPGTCESKPKRETGAPICGCPANIDPVCGTDGQTYSNECLLSCNEDNTIQVQYKGECRSKREADDLPLCICNANIDYVCGSDGKTYSNKCLLECENKNLEVKYEGPCQPDDEDSLCVCPENIDFVCGTDGETYSNECLLNCNKNNVQVQYKGECKSQRETDDAPICACPANIAYVCGSDGETYSNKCLLDCENKNLEVQYEGPCQPKDVDTPLCACPANIDPVCGTDGKTYPNSCLLDCEQGDIKVQYKGECKSKREADDLPLCACPDNIAYVCGSDGETYSNKCLLDCENKNLEVQYEGPCQPKDINTPLCACPANIDPVCGTDGKTYPNSCLLDCEQGDIKMQYKGECRSKRAVDDIAPCACPANIFPVCGTDGETYPNECLLDCEKPRKNVQLLHVGECRSKRDADSFNDSPICGCPAISDPVCGTDGRTYPNSCLLDCQQADVKVQYKGACRSKRESEDLSCPCFENILPVCGTDGETYSNECLLECEKQRKDVDVAHQGECRSKRQADYPICACPANIDYVCGTDGRTYSNKCIMDCKRQNIQVQYRGPCRNKREEIKVAALNLPKCDCPGKAKPVCGNDGVTYQSACNLDCAKAYKDGLHVEHEGECEFKPIELPEGVRPCACRRNLAPVCASDGKTYGNQCVMECSDPSLTIAHNGPCKKNE